MNGEAKVSITFINQRTGQVARLDDFHLRPDLALRLVGQIEAALADLAPGQIKVRRRVTARGITLIDIDPNPSLRPRSPSAHLSTTFEQLYRRSAFRSSISSNQESG